MNTKHTPGPWFAGYGEGLTGPTTPSFAGPCCGGKNWGYEPVRCGDRTIAICPNQEAATLRISDIKGSAAANARLIAASPRLCDFVNERAEQGDAEALNLLIECGLYDDSIEDEEEVEP